MAALAGSEEQRTAGCEYGGCPGAGRVQVELAFGALLLCLGHWHEVEETFTATTSFLDARLLPEGAAS